MFTRHPLRAMAGSRVTVRNGEITWRGVLAAYSTGWLELKKASALDPVTGQTSADGIIMIPETRIDYMQVIPEEE